jgi:hypothetical protein
LGALAFACLAWPLACKGTPSGPATPPASTSASVATPASGSHSATSTPSASVAAAAASASSSAGAPRFALGTGIHRVWVRWIDEGRLVTVATSQDQLPEAIVWNVATATAELRARVDDGGFPSADGRTVTFFDGRWLEVQQLASGAIERKIRPQDDDYYTPIHLTKDGRLFTTGLSSKCLHVFGPTLAELPRRCGVGSIDPVAVADDGSRVAISSRSAEPHEVRVVAIETGKVVARAKPKEELSLGPLAIAGDGSRIAFVAGFHDVVTFDVDRTAFDASFDERDRHVSRLALSADGKRLAIGWTLHSFSGDRLVTRGGVDVAGYSVLSREGDLSFEALAFSPSGKRLAIAISPSLKELSRLEIVEP